MQDDTMVRNEKEYAQVRAGVLGYLQRDIEKLLDTKCPEAEFVNIASSNKAYGTTWLLFNIYYTWYESDAYSASYTERIKVVYPIQKNLYTRDPSKMQELDKMSKIVGKQKNLSDIDLVKIRILRHIFDFIMDIRTDSTPIKLPTKKIITLSYNDSGTLKYYLFDTLPSEFN